MSKSLEWLMGKSNGQGGCCVVREKAKVQMKFAFLFRSLSTDFFPEDTDLFSWSHYFQQKFRHLTLNNI